MPRRSTFLDPADGPLAQFALDLRQLRDRAPGGRPGSVDRVADLPDIPSSRSSIYAALRGERLPSRETLAAMVTAWAPAGERDLPGWMERRSRCEAQLTGSRATRVTSPSADGESRKPQSAAEAQPERARSARTPKDRPDGARAQWANEALASWLSALREREGITIRELAKRVRMPVSTVGAYLSGANYPGKRETLERLLEGLNADEREGHYAIGCWYDHQIGMDPASPPRIAPRIDDPIDTRTSWSTGKPDPDASPRTTQVGGIQVTTAGHVG